MREHTRLDELLAELGSARQALLQAVDEAPESLRREKSRDDGWTLSQILEHLALVESGSGRLIARLVREAREQGVEERNSESVLGALDHVGMSVPRRRFNAPSFAEPLEGLSIEQSVERLQDARAKLLRTLEGAKGLALDTVSAPHPAVGTIDGYGWILATAQHERRHTYQIRQLANQEHRA